MTDPQSPLSPADETLAARAAARLMLAALSAVEPRGVAAVSRATLAAFARREPGAPVDFAVERALRTDPAAARLYRKTLALMSVARSVQAAAAHDGGPIHRRVDGYALEVVEEEGAPPTLVIACPPDAAKNPTILEVVSVEGVVRLDLPEPTEGHIVLDLPPGHAERDLLRLMLANPLSGVYLL